MHITCISKNILQNLCGCYKADYLTISILRARQVHRVVVAVAAVAAVAVVAVVVAVVAVAVAAVFASAFVSVNFYLV